VVALDLENFHEWNSNLLSNSIGSIQLSDLKILPPGQKPRREIPAPLPSKPSSAPLIRSQSAPKQKTETKEEIPTAARSFFDKKSTSSSNSKTTKVSTEKESSSSAASRPPLGTKKTVSNVKPAKGAPQTAPHNPLIASEDESSDLSQQEPVNKKKVMEVETEEEDEDEWEEGGFNTGGGKSVLNKDKIQKRDEIQSINDHFLGDESSEEEETHAVKETQKRSRKTKGKKRMSGPESGGESDNDSTDDKKSKKQKRKQKEPEILEQKIQIHGAMDDFFEDMTRKHGADGTATKKKRTKLVEKVRVTSCLTALLTLIYL
jgi:hypothetical protein